MTCAATLAIAASGAAAAAPCAGFNDIDSSHSFCPHVEWLKNRAITLGCTSATLYCPGHAVSRLQMAAFLNRLGTALTPVLLRVDAAPGAVDLDANTVICQTTDFATEDFPRRAFVDLSFAAMATADVNLAADLAMSTDGGGTWTNLNAVTNRGSVAANQWGGLSDVGYADLNVGQTVRWGVRMTRGGVAGTTDLSDGRCQVRALVYSRDGPSSPF
jgi:hypothetical protein